MFYVSRVRRLQVLGFIDTHATYRYIRINIFVRWLHTYTVVCRCDRSSLICSQPLHDLYMPHRNDTLLVLFGLSKTRESRSIYTRTIPYTHGPTQRQTICPMHRDHLHTFTVIQVYIDIYCLSCEEDLVIYRYLCTMQCVCIQIYIFEQGGRQREGGTERSSTDHSRTRSVQVCTTLDYFYDRYLFNRYMLIYYSYFLYMCYYTC